MKTPLRYQITEFDCGSVSLINCIVFLFEREEIPAELIKQFQLTRWIVMTSLEILVKKEQAEKQF